MQLSASAPPAGTTTVGPSPPPMFPATIGAVPTEGATTTPRNPAPAATPGDPCPCRIAAVEGSAMTKPTAAFGSPAQSPGGIPPPGVSVIPTNHLTPEPPVVPLVERIAKMVEEQGRRQQEGAEKAREQSMSLLELVTGAVYRDMPVEISGAVSGAVKEAMEETSREVVSAVKGLATETRKVRLGAGLHGRGGTWSLATTCASAVTAVVPGRLM